MRICIVDDDDIYQFTMKLNLRPIDSVCEVKTFNDGLAVLDFIKTNLNNLKELPDIIFLDINMPVMDGFQFIEEYVQLEISKKISIFMVSSSIDPVDVEKVKGINQITDYLVKPVEPSKLKTIIDSLAECN